MVKILGIRVDDLDETKALALARSFLLDERQHTIFTPNPEMLVAARKNLDLHNALNNSSLNLCDGRGAQLFGRLTNRVSGVDFMQSLCALAAHENRSVYLLGSGSSEVVENTKKMLVKNYPTLCVVGVDPGPRLDAVGKGDSRDTIACIHSACPDILFVAFGHQKQELWIQKYLPDLPSVQIAMGVGGAFDLISGNKKRAPILLRTFGLEWAWRLLLEPRRIKRILTAVFIFPLYILKSKF
ncbi:MAG: hypothetical protein COV60_02445 [Candidatus Magasanikbacteria bacterium CG11_big_fil_rev_8_21_14_0_20_43_7]|uniref:Glycosyltransferase n=1 Tax=Candidatus Magasanikbacteria bacterium CG11_big_fil_rev_8_21_14_0_20_43_7 TaxID=1974654 RepID=A0A2H0N2C1_9BACT|nr:MAG: hypothetical protein COV60_02445 [Candidatus Magasanikbacteria bacterium CG11_big_fil_rev_8_21_14_0_20_43_7]